MFDFTRTDGPKPRCHFTSTRMSHFLNHEQPPTKKRPFSTVLGQPFSHTLDILLPSKAAQTLQTTLASTDHAVLRYARVHMKPIELITGDFFTTYIKSPGTNVYMLSQGRIGLDNTFTLHNGILRLETDKATFERMGLQGTSIPSEGRKHIKTRYAVEINLRLPNMVKGKSGFDRILWAFKNVLDESITWLVYGADLDGPIKNFQPVVREVKAEVAELNDSLTPVFPSEIHEEEYADSLEILEWLSLAMAASPRIGKNDDVDAYLSRYQVPDGYGEPTSQDLLRLRWRGLIAPDFAHKLFLTALKASGDEWIAISACSSRGEAYTIFIKDGQAFTWEYKD